MSLSESNMKRFKLWFKSVLKQENVSVTFTKKDGSKRVMRCTTNPTYIMFKDPVSVESKSERRVNEDVMPVFDLDADAWRSFRWDSIKNVTFTFNYGDKNGHSTETQ